MHKSGLSARRPRSGDVIVDNQNRTVRQFLQRNLHTDTHLSVVSAYFTIYAYHDLCAKLDCIRGMRFLYGEPRGVSSVDPEGSGDKAFRLTKDGGIKLKRVLAQKPLAQACAEWIKQKVEIRTIKKSNFLHGKLYHLARESLRSVAVVGSSNFTRSGIGSGVNPNIELNLEVSRKDESDSLLQWFDTLWNDHELTRDAKNEVLDTLERLGTDYPPEFVYYKTLYHVLEDRLADYAGREGLIQDVHLYETSVWQRLYSFQRDGAVTAINRLMRYNGCIIADSVGLGKTWTALAVVKYFEIRNKDVLVLCPKKLEQNWLRYTSAARRADNPLAKDRFGYTVLAHTDLSRTRGMSGVIDLANFNWSAFDLIVIDESHNFRNEGRDRTDEDGNLIARSRYGRLLEEVLKEGARTKVLMLSATPVNTSLRDLRNQIYLITEKHQDAFRDSIGVSDIKNVFRLAQREFQNWEKEFADKQTRDKTSLLERLGADFLAILDAVSIARSRKHIRRLYPDVETKIGGFPERSPPENLNPPTDSKGEFSYDDLHQQISKFNLAVYMPSQYLNDTSVLDAEKQELNFDQRDREHWLVGMMRVNLLKRLESSVYSFSLTMERILMKMDELDKRIERWQADPTKRQLTLLADDDEDDDEFTFGKGRRYRLGELDLKRWQGDLREDRRIFEEIHSKARQVSVERDAKLSELRKILQRKVREAPPNKEGLPNRKVLVFTSFSDTARYLYEHLEEWARSALDIHIGLVTGSDGNRSTVDTRNFAEILTRFAPLAQETTRNQEEIDILIATDCLSEGQNLQDCDLVVNYDIHWNPVRLMQRFGRIDRLGSKNRRVAMVNFWPTGDLDRYLDLKNRVEARMALVDAAATGQDNPLLAESLERTAKVEIGFRDRQLRRMLEEILDDDEVDDSVAMSDFTLDDFVADLMEYLKSREAELKAAPYGICAVVPARPSDASKSSRSIKPGVIFCLKQRLASSERSPNRLHPYFLTYVQEDGTVRYTFQQSKQVLTLLRALAAGRQEVLTDLVASFDHETRHGFEMTKYEKMLEIAIRKIHGQFGRAQLLELTRSRGARVNKQSESPFGSDSFELVTWLAITKEV